MNKHTPGPWSAVPYFGDCYFIQTRDGKTLCVVHTRDDERSDTADGYTIKRTEIPERHGDARLIAAAPQLLAALKGIVERGTDSQEHKFAEAVIAAAEGGY